jgi:hypothetical protein
MKYDSETREYEITTATGRVLRLLHLGNQVMRLRDFPHEVIVVKDGYYRLTIDGEPALKRADLTSEERETLEALRDALAEDAERRDAERRESQREAARKALAEKERVRAAFPPFEIHD